MMKYSEDKLVVFSCCFFSLLLMMQFHVHGLEDFNLCKSSTCGKTGPPVRFPFRITGKQPDHCGYPQPWFDLSCSENNQTILQLTPSWNLTVKNINYTSQLMSAYDSQGCSPEKILNFNSSLSPFRFNYENYQYDSALFSCPWKNDSAGYQTPCLSDVHQQVISIPSDDTVGYYEYLLSCVKINDISYVPFDYLNSGQKLVNLSWSRPDCRSCEARGEHCRLRRRNTKKYRTECYGKPGSMTKFIATGLTLGSIFLVRAVIVLYRLYIYNKMKKDYQSKIEKFLQDYKSFKPTRFSYAHLKRMTNQFKDELGQGAYGTVYRGKLSDEILVAIKVLNHSKANGEEFINEVGTIGRIHHVNVVRLIGFCAEGFRRALVYEYLPNDSLQKFISSADAKEHFLGWKRLQDIALDVAKGIDYLRQGCDQRILHFDIKPQNILLDHGFTPKVSDFGLAKLCGKDQSIVSMTTAKGTIGYMAPEVFSRNFGNVSFKSDVYSFGMLILEMVGGRKIVDEKHHNDEQIYFPEWIYNLLEEGEDLRLEIGEEGDAKIAKKLAIVGLWCIQWNPTDRPCMKTVIQIMEGDGENLPNPFNSTTSGTKKAKQAGKRINIELGNYIRNRVNIDF